MTARKVVELEIIYPTMNNKASSRLVIVPKTRLEILCVEKIFKKSDLVSVKYSDNLLVRTRIRVSMIENSFLYLLVQDCLTYLLISVRHSLNKETS
jgi:hypothetical protein